jgi:hypothetical protein
MAQTKWVAAWGATPERAWSPEPDHPALHDTTLRIVITPDQLGHSARLHLSNLLGTAPLTIDDASVALTLAGAALAPHTGHAITFKSKRTLTLAPGEETWTDAIALNFIGEQIPGTLVIDALDIMAPTRTQVVAIVGERLGDPDDGWTRMLARRLHAAAADRVTLVDLTRESGRVASLVQQLDRDPPSGASTIILIAGLADVAAGGATPEATAEALDILARRTRARAPGVRLIGATLPPGPEGALPPGQDRSRRALNQFIRLTDVFDAVIDLDSALADPATGWLRPAFAQKGSNLANYGGQLAMSAAPDLKNVIKPSPPPAPPKPAATDDQTPTN